MRRLAIVLLTLATSSVAQDLSVTSTGHSVVHEAVLLDGAPYIEIPVGGVRGLFLFDTGANVSGVDADWLAANRIPYRTTDGGWVAGTTGSIPVTKAVFDRIDLGHGFFSDAVFNLQSFRHFAQPPGRQQIGLLGTDFINCYAVRFDYPRRRIELSLAGERLRPPATWVGVPVEYPYRLPTVRVRVGGVSIPCRLDSGATYRESRVHLDVNRAAYDAIRRAGVRLRRMGSIGVVGISGPEQLPLYEGTNTNGIGLDFGPRRLSRVVLVVHDREIGVPAGILINWRPGCLH